MTLFARNLVLSVLAISAVMASGGCGQDSNTGGAEAAGAAGAESGSAGSNSGGSVSGAADSDAGGELSIEPALFTEENTPLRLLSDGDSVDISQAVQGGQVIYVAARVQNLNAEMAHIEAQLSDPDSGAVRAHDDRTIVMKLVEGEESVYEPDIRSRNQVAHLLVCPNEDERALLEEPWQLDITLSDVDGPRSASVSLSVYPTCENRSSETRARCDCECVPNYDADSCS